MGQDFRKVVEIVDEMETSLRRSVVKEETVYCRLLVSPGLKVMELSAALRFFR